MKTSLPMPTVKLVRAAVAQFDSDPSTGLVDRALAELIHQFPGNTDPAQVLLKVAALNSLYATQIYAVVSVARHIAGLDIDAHLNTGSPDAVDLIATVDISGKQRRNFSFATKYCNWHNPVSYPIYDTQVDASLLGLSAARSVRALRSPTSAQLRYLLQGRSCLSHLLRP